MKREESHEADDEDHKPLSHRELAEFRSWMLEREHHKWLMRTFLKIAGFVFSGAGFLSLLLALWKAGWFGGSAG